MAIIYAICLRRRIAFMPRPLRFEFRDAWYHIVNKGIGHHKIFRTDQHRQMFLNLLADACDLYGIRIHAYCLLDNHYHLLIHTPRGNLARAMRHINGLYTQKFNRSTGHAGPLFRGRYKAIVVDKDNYLLQVSRYIHFNPVTAKLVDLPHRYKWSSYQYYHRKNTKLPLWLQTEEIHSQLMLKHAKETYRQYMKKGIDSEIEVFYKKINTSAILGARVFKIKLMKSLDPTRVHHHKTDYNLTRDLPSMEEIIKACTIFFKVSEEQLYSGRRGLSNNPRKISIYACRRWGGETLIVIAKQYRCQSHSNVTNVVKEINQKILTDEKLKRLIDKLRRAVLKLSAVNLL